MRQLWMAVWYVSIMKPQCAESMEICTHLESVATRVINDVAEYEFEVVHENEGGEVDLEPVLFLPLVDLAIQISEYSLSERV